MDVVIKIYMDSMVELDRYLSKSPSLDDDNNNIGGKCNKRPNFTRGNSLGLLATAEAHRYHGPAMLHWEGGFAGERKIQAVKPQMGIKRRNVDWQKIVLNRLYQNEALEMLLEEDTKNSASSPDRCMEDTLTVFRNEQEAYASAFQCHEPLSVIRFHDGTVWLASRTNKDDYNDALTEEDEGFWT